MNMKELDSSCRRSQAFTLIELLVVIAIIALLIALILPALASAKKAGRMTLCENNLRQMMVAHHEYASDFKDFIAAFMGSPYNGRPDSISSAAKSVICTFTSRPTAGAGALPDFVNLGGSSNGTFVIEQYSHVVLAQYLSGNLPSPVTVCPEDRARLSWHASPNAMASSAFRPTKDTNVANLDWWPYSASYQLDPWACGGGAHPFYYQGATHDTYGAKVILGQKISDVGYASQKVALSDTQQRHFGRKDLFYAYTDAKQPLAFYDGSVSVRRTGDANRGQNPERPLPNVTCIFTYAPDLAFESAVPKGRSAQMKAAYYRWTRGGLFGIDFGGQETPAILKGFTAN